MILVKRSNSSGLVNFDNTSMFCLAFPNSAASFSTAVYWCFARHCCRHRNFQLPTSVLMFLKSSSSGSMKNIPCNFLALSNFRFSIAHVCFALRFDASDACLHISGHTLSGLEVVCFLVSFSTDHAHPCSGFFKQIQ